MKALWTDTADDTLTNGLEQKFTPVTYSALPFLTNKKSDIERLFRNVTVGHRCHDTKILSKVEATL